MASLFVNLVKTARPRQSLKNLALLAPLVFSGYLFSLPELSTALISVFIFSLLTAAVYIFNDIIDLPSDQLHPYKKNRPIASGEFPISSAFFFTVFIAFLALYLAIKLNFFFFLTCLVYLVLQFFYTFYLKKIVLIDVITIATGFVLRVYAGAFALNVHMSVWFLLCVVSLSLFLAVGKRRAELTVLKNTPSAKHRKTLTHYSPEILNNYLSMFSASSLLSYALFTFFEPPPPIFHKFPNLHSLVEWVPVTLIGTTKWLMVTIPLVIFGIMRYTKIIYEGEKAEAPERVLLSDRQLLGSVIIWGLLVIMVIYGLGFMRS
ncbi:MAG: UbiA prenyltransferase family protein [Candidatus Pacebacteria bacterium]|nr:UbiA prenyltransferase family protein [Candidatus Paceibacterota bacterium]